jgi:hypothetical protein
VKEGDWRRRQSKIKRQKSKGKNEEEGAIHRGLEKGQGDDENQKAKVKKRERGMKEIKRL